MGAKKLRMLLLIAISLVIAGFVVAEIESGFNIERAEVQSVGRNILYVGGSGPNNYTLIQDAIDNASDGDTVFVYSGIYYENVVTDKRISLIGEDKETTIIDGSNAGDVVNITADWISMSGFTIRNSGGYWPNAGVKIYRASNNTIYNCNISNNVFGIRLWYSCANTIYNCNISNNVFGIRLWYSCANTIYNCNISNSEHGIRLWYSSNNTIYNCNISNNEYSIWLWYSCANTIYNCNISNNVFGISPRYSPNNTIYNCNISNNNEGILLYSSYTSIYNCNITSNSEHGILIEYSSNNKIYNCNISNNVLGISLHDSCNNSIYNCSFMNDGIAIGGDKLSHFIHNIYTNIINGKPLLYYKNEENVVLDGIEVGEIILANCSNFEIRNENIGDTDVAIEVAFSNKIKIYNCNISNNYYGISLHDSSNNTIYNCNISNNYYGISLHDSSNNTIYNCNIINNVILLTFYSSSNNIWHSPCFITYTYNGSTYTNYLGNYWSEYNGSDTNGDGIGDFVYYVGGSNYDYYPLMQPYENYNVTNFLPVANFSYLPLNPITILPIYFTDLSYDLDGSIVSWYWDFGDGTTSYKQNPKHQYNKEGLYKVNLTVEDDDSAMTTISKNIAVIKPSSDYILVTFETKNEILDSNISTNFSFIAYASAFNYTYGFIEFVDANWSIINYASNASINASHGKSILFSSGWNGGTAILYAEYDGHTDSVVFNINPSLFSFILYKGWNLITLPCENGYNASSLFNDIEGCSIILGWNASIGEFELYAPGIPYDFEIEDGHGYFIGMKNDSIFSLADIPIYNVSIPLYIGWNTLGWFKENETTASSLLENITGCNIVLGWNASVQDFELYAPGVPNDFVVTRGDGFLVAVDEESIWHSEG